MQLFFLTTKVNFDTFSKKCAHTQSLWLILSLNTIQDYKLQTRGWTNDVESTTSTCKLIGVYATFRMHSHRIINQQVMVVEWVGYGLVSTMRLSFEQSEYFMISHSLIHHIWLVLNVLHCLSHGIKTWVYIFVIAYLPTYALLLKWFMWEWAYLHQYAQMSVV